jgi:hypothetical protein
MWGVFLCTAGTTPLLEGTRIPTFDETMDEHQTMYNETSSISNWYHQNAEGHRSWRTERVAIAE